MSGVPPGTRVRAPVFIVGAPRSGTTLLRVVLDRHPQIAMWRGESAFFRRLYDRRSAFGDPGDVGNRTRIVKAYLALEAVKRLEMDLPALESSMMRDGVSWPALFAAMLGHGARLEGKPYWGEKTPAHAFRVETLREWFPQCSIIHIVRDPRDAVSSLIRMPWSNRSVAAGARLWSRSNVAAGRAAKYESYLWVKYENLVASPEAELTRICRHIGLDYDGALLQPKAITVVARPAVARANRPISTGRLEAWRQVLEPWQVAAVEEIAGPLMGEYGYRRETNRASLSDRAKAFAEAVVEVGLQTASLLPGAYFRYVCPTNLEAEERWIDRAGSMYWSVRPAADRVD